MTQRKQHLTEAEQLSQKLAAQLRKMRRQGHQVNTITITVTPKGSYWLDSTDGKGGFFRK